MTETAGALDLRPFDNANTINCTPLPRDNAYIGVTVLGCVIAVVLIILCIYFFKKRKQEKAKEKARTTAPKYDSDNGSHAPPPGETQFVTDVPKELPDVRSYRIGSLASESTDEAYPRRDRQESTISTAISQYRPEPPRFPNIFTYIPELDPEGEPHELGDGEPPGPQEGDLSPLSDRVLD